MQYKVQYFDGSNNLVRETSADTTNMSEFISDRNWPAGTAGMRVLDQNGRRILSYLTSRRALTAVEAGNPAPPVHALPQDGGRAEWRRL
jgi:hypothetical protein